MRKSILASSEADYEKCKEKLFQASAKRVKLRKQNIFTEHRRKMIQKALSQEQLFTPQKLRTFRSSSGESSREVVALLQQLRERSDKLENIIERNLSQEILNKELSNSVEILKALRKIITNDSNSMNDNDDSVIANTFFEQKGVELILPFL